MFPNQFYEILPVFVVMPTIYYIVKISLDYATKKRLIDKGLVGEEAKHLFLNGAGRLLPSSLKWGIVLFLVGMVILLMRLMSEDISHEVALGGILTAAGAGLLIFYFISAKKGGDRQ